MENSKDLKLVLVGLDPPIAISEFDNHGGKLISSIDERGLREGAILTSEGKALWSGVIRINEDSTFDLCVSPAASVATEEVIPWRDLPPFFTIFDGGYESLGQESVNALLDDLVTFSDLVKVRCHFEHNGKQESVSGKWGDQENLKTLSEILIDWNFIEKLAPEQIVLLEVELFETVYFIIAISEESDNEGIVLSLTSHFYQQRNRIGRRIPIEPIEIGGLKILEVSDFGMKVSAKALSSSETSDLSVTINGYQLLFGITYKRKVSPEEIQMGLCIQDHSPEARKAWQGFLLGHQYPLLSYRDDSRQNELWNLYEETGFLGRGLKEIIKRAKSEIAKEWSFIDDNGPSFGATVIGFADNKAVCSIGVSRAIGGLWAAQAATVIDDPKYIPFTREMYSWRTRYILQQKDGDYHLAFFVKNKPFLDRFFRKFYMTRDQAEQSKIIWEEWLYYLVLLGPDKPSSPITKIETRSTDTPKSTTIESSRILELYKFMANRGEVIDNGDSVIVKQRPYIHLYQYMNTVFTNIRTSTIDIPLYFDRTAAFSLLSESALTNEQVTNLNQADYHLHGGHEETIWACPKKQLSNFLSNSLKSLELMQRKYSKKEVA